NSQNMSTGPATPPNVPPTTAPNLPSPSNSSANPNSSPNAPKSAFGKFLNNLSSSKTAGNSQKPTDLSYAGQSIGNLIGTGIKNIFSGSNSKPSSDSSYDQYTGSGFTADQMSNESSRNAAIQAGGIPQPDALDQAGPAQTPQQMSASNDNGMPMIAKGGKVPVLLSPGEKKLTPKQAEKVAKGGKVKGKIVPGKAPIPDDKNHYENDVVKDNAEPVEENTRRTALGLQPLPVPPAPQTQPPPAPVKDELGSGGPQDAQNAQNRKAIDNSGIGLSSDRDPQNMLEAGYQNKLAGIAEQQQGQIQIDLPYEARNMLNLAVNHRIQSSGASIVNRSAIRFYELLKQVEIDAKLVLQVHDSLV
ncbi:unnamed protein product, partial [Sphagnum compactum]